MEALYVIQIGLGQQEHSIKVYHDRVVIQKPKDKSSMGGIIRKELQMHGIEFTGILSFLNAKYIGIDVTFDQIESVDFRPATSEIMMNGLLVINLKGREKGDVTFLNYAKTANAIKFRSEGNETARQIKQYIDSKLKSSLKDSELKEIFRCNNCGCQKMRFFYSNDSIVSRSIGDAVRGTLILSIAGTPGIFRIKFEGSSGNALEDCCFDFGPDDVNAGKKRSEYTEFIHEGKTLACLVCFNLGDHMLKQYIFPGHDELKKCAGYMGISEITTRDIKNSSVISTRPIN